MPDPSKVMELAECELKFLHPDWNSALLGFAERGTEEGRYVLPCYGYQALKAIASQKTSNPEEIYKLITGAIYDAPKEKPLIVTRYNHKALWRQVRLYKYPRWQYLDKAIIGLGREGWENSGLVYNKALCCDILVGNQSTLETNPMVLKANARKTLDETIIPVSLGDYSPWFVTQIK